MFRAAAVCLSVLMMVASGVAQQPVGDDLAKDFKAPAVDRDYDKRVVMVPMRDGTKLYTVIVMPKNAKGAPIVLTRTCYNAAETGGRARIPRR